MNYDPVKNTLGVLFNRSLFLRKLFYRLLDLLLLRTWHIHREIQAWKKSAPSNASILDAGSGFGQYTYYLFRINPAWKILAVDVKEEQVADCNSFFKKMNASSVQFETQDLTKYVKRDSFDMALSVDVMEHILEDVLVFKNICESLHKNGMLLISTPSDQGGSDVDEHDGESFIGEHVRNGYNIKEIEDKLKSAGFTKVVARYSYGTPGKISWRLSMKYPIQLAGVSKIFLLILPFYYVIVYPFCFVLNYLDSVMTHKTGTGLIVKAWK